MAIEVLAPDAREGWTLDATSYTVHADGALDVVLPDGSVRHFRCGEWMDVRLVGSWQVPGSLET